MTNIVNSMIIIYLSYVKMCIYLYFLPNGDIVLITQIVVCVDLY
jgi:hypothetical protein